MKTREKMTSSLIGAQAKRADVAEQSLQAEKVDLYAALGQLMNLNLHIKAAL